MTSPKSSPTSSSKSTTSIPSDLTVHTRSRTLEVSFSDGATHSLSFEFLRVHSPSAEVRGHGHGQEVLQFGKREVGLDALEPVGNYAVQPKFSDGHNTGIYSWDYLHWLCVNRDSLWQAYLNKLQAAGHPGDSGRDAPQADPDAVDSGAKSCGNRAG